MATTLTPATSSQFAPRIPCKFYPNPRFPPPKKKKNHSFRIHCAKSSNPPSFFSLIGSVYDWADAVKERRVRDRRPLYTPGEWSNHRSSRRHLISSPTSRVILSLVPPVSALTAVAAALAINNTAVSLEWSPLPYQLTVPTLALFLVFRTEASYSRLEEGRKAWMRVVAGTGELTGLVMAAKGRDGGAVDHVVKLALLNYIMAFPVALKCHVINGSDIRADLQSLLEEDDLAVVLRSKHRPCCIIKFIS